jgi:signal peptidase I
LSKAQQNNVKASIVTSLYIEALRAGQPFTFRVVSNSMIPTLSTGDSVYIEPAKAKEIRVGDIAAFETPHGLVIHRIVRIQQTETSVSLLQMADVDLHASWVEEHAIIGRVISARRQNRAIHLQHPIAQRCGKITARLRYQLYLRKAYTPLGMILRLCSRWVVRSGYLWIRCRCSTNVITDETSPIYQQ